jgi:hypothetical protein
MTSVVPVQAAPRERFEKHELTTAHLFVARNRVTQRSKSVSALVELPQTNAIAALSPSSTPPSIKSLSHQADANSAFNSFVVDVKLRGIAVVRIDIEKRCLSQTLTATEANPVQCDAATCTVSARSLRHSMLAMSGAGEPLGLN